MPESVSAEAESMAVQVAGATGSDATSSKLLDCLKDYSCSDKIRWNSVEGFMGETSFYVFAVKE